MYTGWNSWAAQQLKVTEQTHRRSPLFSWLWEVYQRSRSNRAWLQSRRADVAIQCCHCESVAGNTGLVRRTRCWGFWKIRLYYFMTLIRGYNTHTWFVNSCTPLFFIVPTVRLSTWDLTQSNNSSKQRYRRSPAQPRVSAGQISHNTTQSSYNSYQVTVTADECINRRSLPWVRNRKFRKSLTATWWCSNHIQVTKNECFPFFFGFPSAAKMLVFVSSSFVFLINNK